MVGLNKSKEQVAVLINYIHIIHHFRRYCATVIRLVSVTRFEMGVSTSNSLGFLNLSVLVTSLNFLPCFCHWNSSLLLLVHMRMSSMT